MDARFEDAESIEALISIQEKLGVVSKTTQLGGAQELSTYLTKKETLENRIFSSVSDKNKQCGRWDLNPHGIATTRSLVLLVCQFRHFRKPHHLYISVLP